MIRRLLIDQKGFDQTAIIDGDTHITYQNLLQRATVLQSHLADIQPQNVAIFLPNSVEYIVAFWAMIAQGITVFPLNTLITAQEILPLLRQASVHIVITSTTYRSLWEEKIRCETLPLQILYIDTLKLLENPKSPQNIAIDTDQPMLLLSTSGTTGKSKIVQLSQRNVEISLLGYLDKMNFAAMDCRDIRYVLAAPFSCVYGIMILSACLMHSFPIVLLPTIFTLDTLYSVVEKHKVTHYEGSTSPILLMEQMAGRPIAQDIASLTCLGFGGSKLFRSTLEKVMNAYPKMQFYQGYGMTETAPLITKHPRGALRKTDSVGNAIQGVSLAIATEREITCLPFVKGEILVKGANIMLGYLHDEEATSKIFKNGYLYTGDIGYLDAQGFLYICGRKKNIIIVRGYNVFPEEVEACIHNSTFSKDCYVYGEMDAQGSEIVCVDLVPAHPGVTIEMIQSYVRASLAAYKQPSMIKFCKHIAKNPSGKTIRI